MCSYKIQSPWCLEYVITRRNIIFHAESERSLGFSFLISIHFSFLKVHDTVSVYCLEIIIALLKVTCVIAHNLWFILGFSLEHRNESSLSCLKQTVIFNKIRIKWFSSTLQPNKKTSCPLLFELSKAEIMISHLVCIFPVSLWWILEGGGAQKGSVPLAPY